MTDVENSNAPTIKTFFKPEAYNKLLQMFLNNESFMAEYNKLLARHPSSLDLICSDWETKLQNSDIFKKWLGKVEYSVNKSQPYYQQITFDPGYHISFTTAGVFHFFRKPKLQQQQEEESNQKKIECFESGPVVSLASVFAEQNKKTKYDYVKMFINKCSPTCSQCRRYGLKGDFCSKTFSFFDGKTFFIMTKDFITKEHVKRYWGVADITINGAIFFKTPGFTDVKLTGKISEAILTLESALSGETDDGESRPILRSLDETDLEQNVETVTFFPESNSMMEQPIIVQKRQIPYSIDEANTKFIKY